MENKKETKTWGFNLEDIEGDIDSVIRKYRGPMVDTNVVIVNKTDEIPEEGFFILMVSKKKEEVTVREFGHDIDSETLEDVFMKIITDTRTPMVKGVIGIA